MVRPFNLETDLADVKAWLHMRGLDASWADDLPAMGVIVPGVAVGFLRKCEGNLGLFDSYLTHPFADPAVRNAALNDVTAALCAMADLMGLRGVLAVTRDEHTATRAIAHGFKPTDWKILSRPTSPPEE